MNLKVEIFQEQYHLFWNMNFADMKSFASATLITLRGCGLISEVDACCNPSYLYFYIWRINMLIELQYVTFWIAPFSHLDGVPLKFCFSLSTNVKCSYMTAYYAAEACFHETVKTTK